MATPTHWAGPGLASPASARRRGNPGIRAPGGPHGTNSDGGAVADTGRNFSRAGQHLLARAYHAKRSARAGRNGGSRSPDRMESHSYQPSRVDDIDHSRAETRPPGPTARPAKRRLRVGKPDYPHAAPGSGNRSCRVVGDGRNAKRIGQSEEGTGSSPGGRRPGGRARRESAWRESSGRNSSRNGSQRLRSHGSRGALQTLGSAARTHSGAGPDMPTPHLPAASLAV